jgi:hypothetical protein
MWGSLHRLYRIDCIGIFNRYVPVFESVENNPWLTPSPPALPRTPLGPKVVRYSVYFLSAGSSPHLLGVSLSKFMNPRFRVVRVARVMIWFLLQGLGVVDGSLVGLVENA